MTTFLKSFVRPLVVAVLAGAFLAAIGAMGTGGAPLVPRVLYWMALCALGAVAGTLVAHAISRFLPGLDAPWLRGLLIVAALTPLFALVVWLTNGRHPLSLAVIGTYLGVTLIMTSGMTTLMMLASRRPIETHAAPPRPLRLASWNACPRACAAARSMRWRPKTTICACTPRGART